MFVCFWVSPLSGKKRVSFCLQFVLILLIYVLLCVCVFLLINSLFSLIHVKQTQIKKKMINVYEWPGKFCLDKYYILTSVQLNKTLEW